MNRLIDALWRPEPTLAVVVAEPLSDAAIQDISEKADVVEFRADKFTNKDPDYLTRQIGRMSALPLILTIRLADEGGSWTDNEEERFNLFSDLLPYADGIDVELYYGSLTYRLTDKAHVDEKVVIASSHYFEGTPTLETLELTQINAVKTGADYTKVAASAKTLEEYERLVAFTGRYRDDSLIVVAMDDYGPLSRITLPGIGSHLTYSSISDEPVVPGQMNYLETSDLLKKLYPGYAELKN